MVNAPIRTVRDQELESETLRSKKPVGNANLGKMINQNMEMETLRSFYCHVWWSAELEFSGGKTVNWFPV